MSEMVDTQIYPVVATVHWSCPECKNKKFLARNSITEHRSYTSPMIVRADGTFVGDFNRGDAGDVYESEFSDGFDFECSNCGDMIDYKLKPDKGSVADLIMRAKFGVNGVDASLKPNAGDYSFLTCDSDGALKGWKYSPPECAIFKGQAVWGKKKPKKGILPDPLEAEDDAAAETARCVGTINPQITAVIPAHMLHMVGWVSSHWHNDDATGDLARLLHNLIPLPPSDDWWKVQQVEHKVLY
jgi:predicted RNA-binding Zn-ribbon protein involved in translation (DUF1610 family)